MFYATWGVGWRCRGQGIENAWLDLGWCGFISRCRLQPWSRAAGRYFLSASQWQTLSSSCRLRRKETAWNGSSHWPTWHTTSWVGRHPQYATSLGGGINIILTSISGKTGWCNTAKNPAREVSRALFSDIYVSVWSTCGRFLALEHQCSKKS